MYNESLLDFVRIDPHWANCNTHYPIGKSVWDYFSDDVCRTIDGASITRNQQTTLDPLSLVAIVFLQGFIFLIVFKCLPLTRNGATPC